MLLAIDTSAGTSVAIVDGDGNVLAERSEADTMRHAEVVGQLIADCLAQASASGADITAVVAGMGPGPFTGLRVGIAAARVFALAIGRPLLALASHDAVALEHYDAGDAGDSGDSGDSGELLVATDARRRELFWSRYAGIDALGLPIRIGGPAIIKPADLAAQLEAEAKLGAEHEPEHEPESELADEAKGERQHAATARVDATEIPASALARIAVRRLAAGLPFEADEALYLRSPDVTPPTGIKRVTR